MRCSHPSSCSVLRSWVEVLIVAGGLSWNVATFLSVLCRDLVLRWSLLQRARHGELPPFLVFCAEILFRGSRVAEGLPWGVATLPVTCILCRDLVSRQSLLQRACHGVLPPFPVFCAEILYRGGRCCRGPVSGCYHLCECSVQRSCVELPPLPMFCETCRARPQLWGGDRRSADLQRPVFLEK